MDSNGIPKSSSRTPIIIVSIIVAGCVICVGIVCGLIYLIFSGVREDTKNLSMSGSDIVDNIDEFVDEQIIGSNGEAEVQAVSIDLTSIIHLYQLQTMSYSYSSIYREYDDEELLFCVKYDGTIDFRLDMNSVIVSVDNDKRTINVLLPELTVVTEVDPAVDYIFQDNSFNSPELGSRILSLCKEDLDGKVPDDLMWKMAHDSAVNEVATLTQPLVDEYYPGYELDVSFA